MTRITLALLVAAGVWLPAHAVLAQEPPARAQTRQANAHETREQLEQILRQYPPSLAEVLKRDPTLLTRADYLAPYPMVVAFLGQHPEVAHNPGFFFGQVEYFRPDSSDRILGMVMGAGAFVIIVSLVAWLIRAVIEQRRWLRVSRVQTEIHTKLMDRFTANEDLMTYIQSPAGRRFLEAAPLPVEGDSPFSSAPLGRILWSLQAGIVLLALGIGFWVTQNVVLKDSGDGFSVLGVLATALGAGFIASGVASYFISMRLGLLSTSRS